MMEDTVRRLRAENCHCSQIEGRAAVAKKDAREGIERFSLKPKRSLRLRSPWWPLEAHEEEVIQGKDQGQAEQPDAV